VISLKYFCITIYLIFSHWELWSNKVTPDEVAMAEHLQDVGQHVQGGLLLITTQFLLKLTKKTGKLCFANWTRKETLISLNVGILGNRLKRPITSQCVKFCSTHTFLSDFRTTFQFQRTIDQLIEKPKYLTKRDY